MFYVIYIRKMKRIISTNKAPAAIGPYSQAVEANGNLYLSGQLPINPISGKIESEDITEQTHQVFKNIATIIDAAGYTMSDIIANRVYLTDMADFAAMNEVYAQYFEGYYPARAAFAVKALPLGAKVEIESIAFKRKR